MHFLTLGQNLEDAVNIIFNLCKYMKEKTFVCSFLGLQKCVRGKRASWYLITRQAVDAMHLSEGIVPGLLVFLVSLRIVY